MVMPVDCHVAALRATDRRFQPINASLALPPSAAERKQDCGGWSIAVLSSDADARAY
jgi:hypothetical protein